MVKYLMYSELHYTLRTFRICYTQIIKWINRRLFKTYSLIEDCARCDECGRNVHDFNVPNKLWNDVIGSPNKIFCYDCFCNKADEKYNLKWRMTLRENWYKCGYTINVFEIFLDYEKIKKYLGIGDKILLLLDIDSDEGFYRKDRNEIILGIQSGYNRKLLVHECLHAIGYNHNIKNFSGSLKYDKISSKYNKWIFG